MESDGSSDSDVDDEEESDKAMEEDWKYQHFENNCNDFTDASFFQSYIFKTRLNKW